MEVPYKIVIGLEVHVQLSTRTKLFCGCSTEFGAAPNTQVCPVCLGQPGALPVMNRSAIDLAIRTGLALNCEIASVTKWDRKNYFYPDLPKGYQISQFDQPICGPGYLEFSDPDQPEQMLRVRLIRAHLEEDAGKSMHDEAAGKSASRIDLNRTGTPLLEIVSEPDLHSPQAAKAYLTELRLLLTYLGVSDCNMQEGSLRADANINLHIDRDGETLATPIVEVKNLNSFRAVERALIYESQRQYDEWQRTGAVLGDAPKRTFGWDDQRGVTIPQREKEESSDYRYFPDPDLVPVHITSEQLEYARSQLGESPSAIRQRLVNEHALKPYDADVIVSQGRGVVDYFDRMIQAGANAKRSSSWIQQEVLRVMNESNQGIEDFCITAEQLSELVLAVDAGDLDTTRAKDVFQYWLQHPGSNVQSAKQALGIKDVDQSEIEALCRELLAENPKIVAQYKEGNTKALGALIGAAKKKNANADPRLVRELSQKIIEAEL
ncbi:MAG: Asp-tRNA(Asn)/Glu-tRNA(Gln) amidotransferase subunit GatB [bacterium]|nr:Asp-tRNA(Asn)/Glu-tRNA(Gln) amidotransferase subunit GatB [bacterium]